MELAFNETLEPVPADTWAMMTEPVVGPGTFVIMLNCALTDADSLDAQVLVDPEGMGTLIVVEEHTGSPADRASATAWAGFQSAPVPLVSSSWTVKVRAKHDSTSDQSIVLRVIKL